MINPNQFSHKICSIFPLPLDPKWNQNHCLFRSWGAELDSGIAGVTKGVCMAPSSARPLQTAWWRTSLGGHHSKVLHSSLRSKTIHIVPAFLNNFHVRHCHMYSNFHFCCAQQCNETLSQSQCSTAWNRTRSILHRPRPTSRPALAV